MTGAPTFVGREREMEALLSGLEDAVEGRGRLFLLSGEPGIGKSRLADEFASLARERGARVLPGRCWEGGGAPPYWPWVQVVRAYMKGQDTERLRSEMGAGASDVAQMAPEVRDIFPDLPPSPELEPEAARFRLFDSTTGFLVRASAQQPLLITLEDLHAADIPSLLLLRFLAAQLADSRMVIVASYRDVELTPDHPLTPAVGELSREGATRRLPLEGLAERDVGVIVERATGTTPAPALVSALYEGTEGNPLFVGEAVRLLASEGRLRETWDPASFKVAVPQELRQVILRRLSHLSADTSGLLRLAAVLGPEFSLDSLGAASGVQSEGLLDVLGEAEATNLVVEVPGAFGQLRFAHSLVRETLYEEITPGERVRLHRRIGAAFESLYAEDLGPHLPELAHHFFEAAHGGDVDRAIDYARSAADQSVGGLAYEDAVRLYQMALRATELKHPSDEVTTCELLISLGDAQIRAGDLAGGRRTSLRAAELARASGLAEHLARAALGYGGRFVWARAATDKHLIPLLRDALAVLGDEDSPLKARLLARLAGALRSDPSPEPRESVSIEAVALARRLDDPATLAYALEGRSAALWNPFTTLERLPLAQELFLVAEEAGDIERLQAAHFYRLLALFELGDMAGVHAELDMGDRLTREIRQPGHGWISAALRALLAEFEGRFDEAEALEAEAFRLGQHAHGFEALASLRLRTMAIRREQGRLAEMETAIRSSLTDFPWFHSFPCALALLLAELGRREEARAQFEALAEGDFAAIYVDNEWLYSMTLLTEVAAYLGDLGRAARLYERLLPLSDRIAITQPEGCNGSTSRYLGLLASTLEREEAAVKHLEQGLAMNERMGAPVWSAHTRHDLATVLARRDGPGDREHAVHLLEACVATCQDVGMPVVEGKAAKLLEELGGTPARSTDATPAASSLVPQPSTFRREGEYFSIVFDGHAFRLRDAKGLRYLARLLASPGQEIHALELVAAEEGVGVSKGHGAPEGELVASGFGDAGEILDPEAKTAYRRRIKDLEEEIAEAESWNDPERESRARQELEFLAHELAAATGLGGRDRRAVSAAERARVNVTRAIKAALSRIAEHDSELGQHLNRTVRTGTFCSYTPDPRAPIDWRT
jgi:tetratricopeptide (TPR) repeat protein